MSELQVPPPPRPSRRRFGVAAAVAVAALAVLVVAGLVTRGSDVAVAPEPGPAAGRTPAPAPSPPTGTPATPSPTPTATLEPLAGPRPEGIDAIAEQVSGLRGLPISEPLDARAVAQADLGARYAELARAEIDPVEIAGDERLLAALRLLEPGVDLLEVIEGFYAEQVLGLYVSEEKVLYVAADEPALSPAQQATAAHEVVHALQDQRWDLQSLLDFDSEASDEALAALALVEGDATLTQEVWALRHQSSDERGRAREEALALGSDAFRDAPRYVRDAILFPYREGGRFVQALVEHGGFEAVDAAFDRLPRSTAEILHPQRYLEGRGPVEVTVTATPGPDWDDSSVYTFGEFDLAQLFSPLGASEATELAAGWSGGSVRHWQRGTDDAVAVAVRFDSEADAAAVCDATPVWYETVADAGGASGPAIMRGDRDWMAWTCAPSEVRIGVAPDEATASALAGS